MGSTVSLHSGHVMLCRTTDTWCSLHSCTMPRRWLLQPRPRRTKEDRGLHRTESESYSKVCMGPPLSTEHPHYLYRGRATLNGDGCHRKSELIMRGLSGTSVSVPTSIPTHAVRAGPKQNVVAPPNNRNIFPF